MAVMEGADAGPADVWRRLRLTLPGLPQQGFRFGVPSEEFTEFDGPGKNAAAVAAALFDTGHCCIPSWHMRTDLLDAVLLQVTAVGRSYRLAMQL